MDLEVCCPVCDFEGKAEVWTDHVNGEWGFTCPVCEHEVIESDMDDVPDEFDDEFDEMLADYDEENDD